MNCVCIRVRCGKMLDIQVLLNKEQSAEFRGDLEEADCFAFIELPKGKKKP